MASEASALVEAAEKTHLAEIEELKKTLKRERDEHAAQELFTMETLGKKHRIESEEKDKKISRLTARTLSLEAKNQSVHHISQLETRRRQEVESRLRSAEEELCRIAYELGSSLQPDVDSSVQRDIIEATVRRIKMPVSPK